MVESVMEADLISLGLMSLYCIGSTSPGAILTELSQEWIFKTISGCVSVEL